MIYQDADRHKTYNLNTPLH